MKSKILKGFKYLFSSLFFYSFLNFYRNNFGKPIFYDVFLNEEKKSICVVAPYYSKSCFERAICEYVLDNNVVISKPNVCDDPDRNCLIVLFKIPEDERDSLKFLIRRNGYIVFSGEFPIAKKINKRQISITTLFKYEVSFLKEWLDYHIRFGIDHFYLYENNFSFDKRVFEILKPYKDKGLVTHILWPYPYAIYNFKLRRFWPNDSYLYTQSPQINHALYKYSKETEWLLCCDVDEYFHSLKYNNIKNIIYNVVSQNNVASIKISGFWFGAIEDEIKRVEKKGVLETFKYSEKFPTSNSKCIFNTSKTQLASVHNLVLGSGNEESICPLILRFNHYRGLGWKKRIDINYAREIKDISILSQSTVIS